MAEIVIKLPDIGEGIAEAEISEWLVEVGAWIAEDDPIGVVMTDKAAVEIPSSVAGRVTWRAGEPGEMLAVGAPLVKIEVAEDGTREESGDADAGETATNGDDSTRPRPKQEPGGDTEGTAGPDGESGAVAEPDPVRGIAAARGDAKPREGKALAAPAVRRRAADLGLSLAGIEGTGPEGRVTHADLDRALTARSGMPAGAGDGEGVTEIKVIGLRRKIAEKMTLSHARIPQITIVEEVDVTELERLRARLNEERREGAAKLTLLPFLIRAMVVARPTAPQVNALYDDEAGLLRRHGPVHVGVATQTEHGLVVPVLRDAHARSVPDLAAGIARLAAGARERSLDRADLSGATITVTSLGPLGALASTPIVNHPEVAILGVNRKQIRPMWDGHAFRPREMMNVSASFDHRIVDGWDAATFVARLKTVLETPGLLFA